MSQGQLAQGTYYLGRKDELSSLPRNLATNIAPSIHQLGLEPNWVFYQDNDPTKAYK